MAAHGHVVALEGRACALACFPVTGTCLAELSKPCANLALPCSTTAFSWGPATKRKGKSMGTTLKCPLDHFILTIPFWKASIYYIIIIFIYTVNICKYTVLLQTDLYFQCLVLPSRHTSPKPLASAIHHRTRSRVTGRARCGRGGQCHTAAARIRRSCSR